MLLLHYKNTKIIVRNNSEEWGREVVFK